MCISRKLEMAFCSENAPWYNGCIRCTHRYQAIPEIISSLSAFCKCPKNRLPVWDIVPRQEKSHSDLFHSHCGFLDCINPERAVKRQIFNPYRAGLQSPARFFGRSHGAAPNAKFIILHEGAPLSTGKFGTLITALFAPLMKKKARCDIC